MAWLKVAVGSENFSSSSEADTAGTLARPEPRGIRWFAEYPETVNKSKALLAAAEEAVRFASAAKKGQ